MSACIIYFFESYLKVVVFNQVSIYVICIIVSS